MMKHAWTTARKVWGISTPPMNPFDYIELEKEAPARDRVLTKAEYAKLLESCTNSNLPPLLDAVKFAYLTGARQGEQLRLKLEHVDFERRVLTFYDTKNGEDRTIPLSDTAFEILKRHRFGDTLFNILARRLRKHFNIACRRAAISNFRFHDLRACFITNALLSGMSEATVAAISGHKDYRSMKRYTRIKAQDLIDDVNKISAIREYKKINS